MAKESTTLVPEIAIRLSSNRTKENGFNLSQSSLWTKVRSLLTFSFSFSLSGLAYQGNGSFLLIAQVRTPLMGKLH